MKSFFKVTFFLLFLFSSLFLVQTEKVGELGGKETLAPRALFHNKNSNNLDISSSEKELIIQILSQLKGSEASVTAKLIHTMLELEKPAEKIATQFGPADSTDLKDILAVHNDEAWADEPDLQLTKRQMSRLIERGLVYVLKVKGQVKGVLLTYPLRTGGDISQLTTMRLWDQMVKGKVDHKDADTILFWAIGTAKNVRLGRQFVQKAKAHFSQKFENVATFSPVKKFNQFKFKLIKKGIAPELIEKLGIFLYLVALQEGSYQSYLSYIEKHGFMLPDLFFKKMKKRRKEPVANFHGGNGAVMAAVLPYKRGFTRPDSSYTLVHSYQGFNDGSKGFIELLDNISALKTPLADLLDGDAKLQEEKRTTLESRRLNTLSDKLGIEEGKLAQLLNRKEDLTRLKRLLMPEGRLEFKRLHILIDKVSEVAAAMIEFKELTSEMMLKVAVYLSIDALDTLSNQGKLTTQKKLPWPNIIDSFDNLGEYEERIRSISPDEAATGGLKPLDVYWEDLTYVGEVDEERYPYWYRDRQGKDYIVKVEDIGVDQPDHMVAHFIGERLFRLLGIPTTESQLLRTDEGDIVVIMPYIKPTSRFSLKSYTKMTAKYQKLIRAVSLLDDVIDNFDRRGLNILLYFMTPIFIDTDVAFGAGSYTSYRNKLLRPKHDFHSSKFFYEGLLQPSPDDLIWMGDRFLNVSIEQFEGIVNYAVDNVPETTLKKSDLVNEFRQAQKDCQILIERLKRQRITQKEIAMDIFINQAA
ncbi:hypothetical protein ACFLQ1_00445 [Candidatus Auribacterota bacterium]